MQVKKLQEQQGIKLAPKKPSTETRFAILEAQLKVNSQFKEGDVMKKEGETPQNPAVACQALCGKHKETC